MRTTDGRTVFEKHWFPDLPTKGQGYRCIRINGFSPTDLCLELAASKCGLRYTDLRLPTELTVWVDPSEVCYRLGESEGSYCTLAKFPMDVSSSSLESSTCSSPATTPPSTPTQEKTRKVQRSNQQRYQHPNYVHQQSIDFSMNRYRNQSNVMQSPSSSSSSSVRAKNSPRDVSNPTTCRSQVRTFRVDVRRGDNLNSAY
ncbi:hypothetical protein WA026_016309 [Henosepilachna vigintioctopunctata]|uniref:Anti-proliferative protein domain-containing protein n=1 Tax=Henosepilachna vigintioctopunctata TaxID=420089 RepID=A0AAW1UKU0_9CUCU